MAAKSTRDLVRNLQLAAAGQADLVVKPVGTVAESAVAPVEPPAATDPPPAAPAAPESERPVTARVRSMSLPELKEAYGVQVPDDESICQYTIRVPKWLRHVIAQQCMLRGLSSQDFGMMAVQMLLEEMAVAENR